MHRFLVRRLLLLLPIIIGVTFLVFAILSLTPGDPAMLMLGDQYTEALAAELRDGLGLDDPLPIQYLRYMVRLLKGDMGTSYIHGRSVAREIAALFPQTLRLTVAAMIFSILVSLPVGIVSAIKQYSTTDYATTVVAMIAASVPNFWLGLMLILVFALRLGWLPSTGASAPFAIVLPAVTLGLQTAANIIRMTRSSMLEVIRQDFIRTAKAKGVSRVAVVLKHALRNALIPVVTVIGLQFGRLLGGSIIIETVFAWPGLGRMMIDAIRAKDTPVVLGSMVVLAVAFSVVNLAVDIVYGFIDPRIRAKYR